MKYTYTFLVMFIGILQAHAQTTFAPLGAQWHHDMQYGVFREIVTGDTTINGMLCTKVEQKALEDYKWYALGLKVNDLRDLFFTSNSDTVFIYNDYKMQFTPVYVFNVLAGDTVTLPVFPPLAGGLNTGIADSTFSVLVDSVKLEVYDTTTLKTIYTHPVSGANQFKFTYNGAYAQKLGCVNGGLIPVCIGCPVPTSDAIQFPTGIRCYNDSAYSVKLTSGDCAKGIKVSVEAASAEQAINIYPNPAHDKLYIKGIKGSAEVSIYNSYGQPVINAQLSDNSLDVSMLPSGIYYLHLAGEQTNATARFIKE